MGHVIHLLRIVHNTPTFSLWITQQFSAGILSNEILSKKYMLFSSAPYYSGHTHTKCSQLTNHKGKFQKHCINWNFWTGNCSKTALCSIVFSSNILLFKNFLSLDNWRKSQGAVSWGIAKTAIAADVLPWWICHSTSSNFCGHLQHTESWRHVNTSKYKCWVTVCLCGAYSWCTIPMQSKKTTARWFFCALSTLFPTAARKKILIVMTVAYFQGHNHTPLFHNLLRYF